LRLKALLRRAARPAPTAGGDELKLGAFRFRLDRLVLFRGEERVKLTETEARLLGALARKAGAPMSREALAAETGAEGGERAIDAISRPRAARATSCCRIDARCSGSAATFRNRCSAARSRSSRRRSSSCR